MRAGTILALLLTSTASTGVRAETPGDSDTSVIVVTAPRQEEAARVKQKDAAVIVNVQSIETIRKYPDFNAAEALGRIPGLSLSSDTGEGRFVNIRGIDANLNGATYGGVVLLNTFAAGTAASGSGRAVEFDTVPTGAIDGIVVYKTLSPDREAEGLGGQIELTPRTARNITKPFVEIELGAGYEPLHKHGGPWTGSIAAGAKIGDVSFVINGSRKDDRRGVDDTEPSYANDAIGVPPDMVLGRTDFRRYDYSRRRFGYGGEVDYTPSDDHRYYARLDIAGYIERSLKNHFYANFDGKPSAPDASGYVVDKFQPQVDVVNLQETHRNTVGAIGGEDHFGNLVIDYRAAYSRATYNEGYYHEARFFGNDTYYGRYNNTANPENFSYQFFNDQALTIPFVSTDATQYGAPNGASKGYVALTAFSEKDTDREYSGVFNARYPLTLLGSTGEIKAGISIRRRDKVVNDFGAFGSASVNLSSYAQSVGPAESFYFGRYPTAPVVNYGAIETLVLNGLPSLPPSLGRDFKDTENVTAGYAMYTVDYGKLGVLTGVRVEATHAIYGNFLTTTIFAADSITPISTTTFVTSSKNYTNVFPTLQLKYAFSPQKQLRATYSTGIARPGFSQAGGNAGVDFTGTNPVFTAGNPNLKPTTGNNFDLDFEYYLPNGGIIELGAFDKEFKNYIFKSGIPDPALLGPKGTFVTFVNENAYARGIELDYHQKFTFLPGALGGLGVEGNLTLVKSRFREYGAAVSGSHTDQYSRLPGTSATTWNLAGFYERGPVNARLSAEYVSSSLFALQGDPALDTIQSARLTLDFTSSLTLTKNYTLFFAAKNLLDTPLRYTDGANSRTQQIEYYGQTYEGGVRIKF